MFQTLLMQIKSQLTPQYFPRMNNFPLGYLGNLAVFCVCHNYTLTVSIVIIHTCKM